MCENCYGIDLRKFLVHECILGLVYHIEKGCTNRLEYEKENKIVLW